MLLYALLPVKFSLEESGMLSVPQDIWYLHTFTPDSFKILVPHLFGWKDWYVFCIMIFYSFFYLSQSLTRSKPLYQTRILWLMLVAYYTIAFIYIGKAEAHWYRYCWVFFLGHISAKYIQKETCWLDLMMLIALSLTILFESPLMMISWLVALIILLIGSRLNKNYVMNSKPLIFLGGISYFFYLSHIRICYILMSYSLYFSVLLWVIITIVVSYALSIIYRNIQGSTLFKNFFE